MKAVVCERLGLPETLSVREVPTPEPGFAQVRVRVHAAGVNFPDTLIIQGKYQVRPPLPFSPGGEVAGVVDALGEGVVGLAIGDRVMGAVYFGGMAEYAIVDAGSAIPMPASMPFDIGAGFITNYATSYHALKQRGALRAGETLLVLGAAGGVGTTAVELGKVRGARVIAAASSDQKLEFCSRWGADETINYTTEDLRVGIKRTTAGRGPDVIYDPVGDKYAEPAFRSIGWSGRYLVIGFAAGEIPRLPFNLPLIKGAAIIGVIYGIFAEKEPQASRQNIAELLDLYSQGLLRPVVDSHFALDDAPTAIRRLMDRKAQGKLVLRAP